MSILNSDNIYFSHKAEQICELQHRFDQLYQEAVRLQGDPENPEYIRVKEKLILVFEKKDRLLRG